MAYPKIILTDEQRREFTQIPQNISNWEIVKYYTFSDRDIEIINRHRREYNRFGFALQFCCLRNPGWSLVNTEDIPNSVLSYIAEQIQVDPKELEQYAQRENTRSEHLQELREIFGFRNYHETDYNFLLQYLLPFALENDNVTRLMKLVIEELKRQLVILPGITILERIVNEVSQTADEQIIRTINNSISSRQKLKLDELIESPDETTLTTLGYLKENPGQASPKAFTHVIDRLEVIRLLNLKINIEDIHPNRIRQLSRLGSKHEPYAFRRFEDNKRHAMLALYLYNLSQSLIDRGIEIHDKLINDMLSDGRKQQDEIQKDNGKSLNEKVIQFINIGAALIRAKNEKLDPFMTIESVMPWEKIVESVEEAKKLTRPDNYDYLDLIDKKYNHLRKYSPSLVKFLQFSSTNKSMEPLIGAVKVLHEMNETNKKKVPDNAPLSFIPKRWNKYVFDPDGSINRHYYEMVTLTELKNRIRSGDIAVNGSHNYKNFDDYLVHQNIWDDNKTVISKLAVSLSFEEYIREREESLNKRLQFVSKNRNKLEGITFDKNQIHVEKLEKDTPEEAKALSESLYKLLPRIKLPDLLIEVANWTNFDKNFIHASTGKTAKDDEKAILMAALMAMGTNIGLVKMADSTPGVTYRQLSNTAQWRIYDEAINRAQASLVNFQHKQFLSSYWGDGSTSSSDGIRVQVGASSHDAEHNPHYGAERGKTIYLFTSDQYSSFYTKVINTNVRDAVHVIDGLLYHESELLINEHYTDTAGYTDQIFGLSHLLGFRFAPRIRDISELKLYSFPSSSDYSEIEEIIQGKINKKIMRDNYDDVLRLAHSIQQGKVSGSLMMSKLGSYSRQNALATALREMGRIEKTIFILDYITDRTFRRRIQRGLNKGEAINALARAIFFGKLGEIRERELQDQLQRASALSLIINAIIVWNTVYLKKAVDYLKAEGSVNDDLLEHIAPHGWEHINFLGDYNFNVKNTTDIDNLRPLNINL